MVSSMCLYTWLSHSLANKCSIWEKLSIQIDWYIRYISHLFCPSDSHLFFCGNTFHYIPIHGISPVHLCVEDFARQPSDLIRLDLYDHGYFGDPSQISFEDAVKLGWREFKQFLKDSKISCSQPSFKAHKVSC